MKTFFDKIKRFFAKVFSAPEVRYVLWSYLAVTVIEMTNSGFVSGLTYPYRHPLAFLCAFSLIYFTLSLSLLTIRRPGVLLLVCEIWAALAITNIILLSYRVNPLSAEDFRILFSVLGIITIYLTIPQLILICAAILTAIAVMVLAFIKLKSKSKNMKRAVITVCAAALVCGGAFAASVGLYKSTIHKMNLPEVYDEYGFVYSFSVSLFDRGIERPDNYSEEMIGDIVDSVDHQGETSENAPNVIFLQLESFFDLSQVRGIDTSDDPIPYFRSLKAKFPSGFLEVPVSGAGTVNTEFEILCGLPLSCFGLGEYPYETVLKDSPCESLAYYLSEAGYACHALHNHTGTFYDRYVVMENLGFDTFTPLEYMNGVSFNELGWAKDDVLTGEVTGVLDSTKGKDFVYTISVQPHGKYSRTDREDAGFTVTGDERFTDEILNAFGYYAEQLRDEDRFIEALLTELEKRDEDTVVVMFGDHLPALDLKGTDVETGSLYKTEYVIWNNFGLELDDADLDAHRLGAYVLNALGINGGIISDCNVGMYGKDGYEKTLNDLSYDVLFGEKFAYGGKFPYKVPDMKLGWRRVAATEAYIKYDTLYVLGENFTPSSVIFVDGREVDTIFVSDSLIVSGDVSEADELTVCQIAENGTVLGEVECPEIRIE